MRSISTITGLMVKDHERLAEIFNDVKNSKDRDSKNSKALFNKLDNGLRDHFSTEEKIINLAFKKRNDHLPIAESLKLDHRRMIGILDNISVSIRNGAAIDASELYLVLRHHKNVEERLFYPELDEKLSEKEKQRIFDNIRK